MPDLNNIQGIVARGYSHPFATVLFFSMPDGRAGAAFIRSIKPLIRNAQAWTERPTRIAQLGVTFAGIERLVQMEGARDAFPDEFITGPSPAMLGDEPAPWNGRFRTADIHLSVHLYGQTAADLNEHIKAVRHAAQVANVRELLPDGPNGLSGETFANGRVHFGYYDGVSQPQVNWSAPAEPLANPSASPGDLNAVDFRHFLLGYAGAGVWSSPNGHANEIQAFWTEFARDGSYLALRWMEQDSPAFETYLDTSAAALPAGANPSTESDREWLAAQLMGRWRDGTPVILSPDGPSPGLADANDFGYRDADPKGTRCPFASHARLLNPRDGTLDPLTPIVPRVIRRGFPYGPVYGAGGTEKRGLIGQFIAASLTRQFEKLMLWVHRTDFSPDFTDRAGQDPVMGDRRPGASTGFRLHTRVGPVDLPPLPRFVHGKGTVYLHIPSMRGLDTLAVGGVVT